MKRWLKSTPLSLWVFLLLLLPWAGCKGGSSPTEPDLIADFTFGGEGLIVEFVDTSSGSVVLWLWEFGDQSRSDIRNPTHEFARADTYIVRLTVCSTRDPEGFEKCDTREKSVIVHDEGPPG